MGSNWTTVTTGNTGPICSSKLRFGSLTAHIVATPYIRTSWNNYGFICARAQNVRVTITKLWSLQFRENPCLAIMREAGYPHTDRYCTLIQLSSSKLHCEVRQTNTLARAHCITLAASRCNSSYGSRSTWTFRGITSESPELELTFRALASFCTSRIEPRPATTRGWGPKRAELPFARCNLKCGAASSNGFVI